MPARGQTLITYCWIALCIAAPLASAGAYAKKPIPVDPNTPEGYFLELIQSQTDDKTKLILIEKFVIQFPKFDSIDSVYADMESLYASMGQFEKALGIGAKILALDALDLESARISLEVAEQSKNPAFIAEWKQRVQQTAQAVISAPAPKMPDKEQAWQDRVDLARQLMGSEEYVLYKKAFDAADPHKKIELLHELETRFPKGQYSKQSLQMYLAAYRQMGDTNRALSVAEKILERDPAQEEVLLFVADTLFRQHGDSKRVLAYSRSIVQVMASKPKPANLSAEEWTRQKNTVTGIAYSMIGGVYLAEEQFPAADQALRQALPLLQGPGHGQQVAAALSFLGWANYKMKNYPEATRFYTQCLGINSPYQEGAAKNLNAIKSEQGDQH
jgi:tetratricopeptide (TPR) repeat protein